MSAEQYTQLLVREQRVMNRLANMKKGSTEALTEEAACRLLPQDGVNDASCNAAPTAGDAETTVKEYGNVKIEDIGPHVAEGNCR